MTARSGSPPAIVLASVAALLPALAAGGTSPLRTLLVVWFLAVCPGLAIVGAIRLGDPWLTAALALALSMALDVIVAGALSYAGLWSPRAILAILVAISCTGAAAQGALAARRAGAEAAR